MKNLNNTKLELIGNSVLITALEQGNPVRYKLVANEHGLVFEAIRSNDEVESIFWMQHIWHPDMAEAAH